MFRIIRTSEFVDWLSKQTKKDQMIIESRISRIEIEGHFGFEKKLEQNLAELKWRNGRRIYYSLVRDDLGKIVILLLGGNKNSQSKDIKKTKSILQKIKEDK